MQEILNKLLTTVIAIDLFAVGILILFLLNFRLNIRRRVADREFSLLLLSSIQNSETTEQVSKIMNMPASEITLYCRERGIEVPETRTARVAEIVNRQNAETRRIMEEEAAWRAEQERINQERNEEREMEAKRRKERLRKFGLS